MNEELHTINTDPILSDELVYRKILERCGGKLRGPENTIEKFNTIYSKLDTIAEEIGRTYKGICRDRFQLNPGRVDLVLGGGRAKGKPLKSDSDLDIFIYVEKPLQSINTISVSKAIPTPHDAQDHVNSAQLKILEEARSSCDRLGVPNDLIEIKQFDGKIPQSYNENRHILLASVN